MQQKTKKQTNQIKIKLYCSPPKEKSGWLAIKDSNLYKQKTRNTVFDNLHALDTFATAYVKFSHEYIYQKLMKQVQSTITITPSTIVNNSCL